VSVELEEVVRRGDESPFGPDGGSASASEAVDAAVELRVGEDRLDDCLALGVELTAALGRVPLRLLASGGISTWMPRSTICCICC
jgi:hypothetical protein